MNHTMATPTIATTAPTLRASVHWTNTRTGHLHGRIPGRAACATVIDHGHIVTAELEFQTGQMEPQEYRSVGAAKAAAEQWLTLIT